MPTMLEIGRRLIGGELEPFPLGKLVGLTLREIEPGRAVFQLRVEKQHHNPLGTLHGGVYCDLADAAMGMAYAAMLRESETFTTVELKINFLRGVREGTLTAEAKVVKAGSTIGYVECDVTDEQGRLAAKAASTCLKLKKEAGK
jgi:uncharacterized protein (TIGR00369 family)